MPLFKKSHKSAGYFAIGFNDGGICAVRVARPASASRPLVELATFQPNPEAGAALEKLARDLHIARHQCGTVLGADEYQLLSVEAPNVPPDELRTAIRWRLKDMLDYHVDDATVDVFDVPVDRSGQIRVHQMFAVAARNQTIQQRQALFDAAKVSLQVIDIPEMAQRNIAALIETEGRATALLSFDENGGLLTITHGKELYLSRRIDAPLLDTPTADLERVAACHERITLELQRSLDRSSRSNGL